MWASIYLEERRSCQGRPSLWPTDLDCVELTHSQSLTLPVGWITLCSTDVFSGSVPHAELMSMVGWVACPQGRESSRGDRHLLFYCCGGVQYRIPEEHGRSCHHWWCWLEGWKALLGGELSLKDEMEKASLIRNRSDQSKQQVLRVQGNEKGVDGA